MSEQGSVVSEQGSVVSGQESLVSEQGSVVSEQGSVVSEQGLKPLTLISMRCAKFVDRFRKRDRYAEVEKRMNGLLKIDPRATVPNGQLYWHAAEVIVRNFEICVSS